MKKIEKFNVAIVGAGFIAETHVRILKSIEYVKVHAVCDSVFEKADAFRKRWGIAYAYDNIDDLLKSTEIDVVHILVPPLFHKEVAEKCLVRGKSVFIEKPMALSTKECCELINIEEKMGAKVGVNHDFNYHPAFLQLITNIKEMKIGQIQHISIVNNMPLRQLITKDFDHWMFKETKNIIFEQGPHIFAHIYKLFGRVKSIDTKISSKKALVELGIPFYDSWQLSVECEKGTAQVFYALGKEFAENRLNVVGQDGVINIDLINNLYLEWRKTKWPQFVDSFLNGYRNSCTLLASSAKNLINYGLSFLKIQEQSDTFYLSMKRSIETFYKALNDGTEIPCGSKEGLDVIDYCEKATKGLEVDSNSIKNDYIPAVKKRAKGEVLVIGGTGFIGGHLVEELTKMGIHVRVMIRKRSWLPPQLRNPLVSVIFGDITERESIMEAMHGISVVYHLATGSGNTWKEIQNSMVDGLKNVVEASIKEAVPKFVFTSSIAVYNLGNRTIIKETTPIDGFPEKRALYARAKIASEKMLMENTNCKGLHVTIFRPAIVIGRGGIPQHSAIGLWVNDVHCFGFGNGEQRLPFVLVEDVVRALIKVIEVEECSGKTFNLAGDIRLTAREYIEYLTNALRRRIHFHPQNIVYWQAEEIGKWLLKKATKRSAEYFPSYRDLRCRAMLSEIDCSWTKKVLNWNPVSDLEIFLKKGILCHAKDDQ